MVAVFQWILTQMVDAVLSGVIPRIILEQSFPSYVDGVLSMPFTKTTDSTFTMMVQFGYIHCMVGIKKVNVCNCNYAVITNCCMLQLPVITIVS